MDNVISPWGEQKHHSISGRSGSGKSTVFKLIGVRSIPIRQVFMMMGRGVAMAAYNSPAARNVEGVTWCNLFAYVPGTKIVIN